ncbi:ABC transporter ATP-binding protein [Salinibius halmophilus]|uniref:ABC transporter ATP-binding protein n=1 Tax=Salinibius halmophilus TaxID=1853216 RepID=UPI001314DF65|nr:ABC transporter ATP-binding protein [Salinibius halmophilus]
MHKQATLWQSFQHMRQLAGKQQKPLDRTLSQSAIAAMLEGAILLALFPVAMLFESDLMAGNVTSWLIFILFGLAVHFALNWHALSFSHGQPYAELVYELHEKLSQQLHRMPLSRLSQYRDGEVANALAASVEHITMPMGTLVQVLVRLAVLPCMVFLGLLWIDWRLAAVMATVILALWPINKLKQKMTEANFAKLSQAMINSNSAILGYSQGMAVLRACNATNGAGNRLRQRIQQLCDIQTRSEKRNIASNISYGLVAELGVWAMLTTAVLLVIYSDLSVLYLPVLAIIMLRLVEPLGTFAFMLPIFSLMRLGAKRYSDLMDINPLPTLGHTRQQQDSSITFKQVHFSYPGTNNPAINDLSLHCQANSITALVGPSGSGKSTLIKLITRYDDVANGSISIGGRDIRSFSQSELMSQIAVVFQDVYLFDDSILNNIAMAKPSASQAEIEAAAKAANCHDFISQLPNGYHTKIGELGGKLSGGQRQRISIARAILKNAPIVLLDEPTAALDSESEIQVQRAMAELAKGRTLIIIAHRLSTIVAADQIVVLDDGAIVEQGQHRSLLEEKGLYHSLWQAQMRTKQWHFNSVE